ncbi:hypothetical protein GCM10010313_71610 [Streptomyces violarus]|uniref:Uncharacterized protein n=1 Tax=Streptomyces violarus TaxID=67380 RepID=A0A7W5F5A0_9ACTN|nr:MULTISPECIES: hypothetical protein [Streptomyces]MBB3080625.1 hypothetical protein [Streptomyces violarus]WRT98457.1 hypothetical protein VJ737_12520 [Streptomyces sp. CGMCC 4.1772]GHD29730.1 hypothetical protein GCM10010313_71610 [Streptomyces violarus]
MSGRADSDTDAEIADSEAAAVQEADQEADQGEEPDEEPDDDDDAPDDDDDDDDDPDNDDDDPAEDARRARWTAAGTGALLTFAGLAAALLRLTRPAPALVPAAYACGAVVCAGAAVLGSRGRTRRALWLLIAGTMVMALGDQFD